MISAVADGNSGMASARHPFLPLNMQLTEVEYRFMQHAHNRHRNHAGQHLRAHRCIWLVAPASVAIHQGGEWPSNARVACRAARSP